MRSYRLSALIAWGTLLLSFSSLPALAQKQKQKQKVSLAEIAALEWKLEQGSNTLSQSAEVAERLKAVAALAGLEDPRAAPALATALREDPDPGVRLKAAEALSALRTPEAKGLLGVAATGDPDAKLRARAVELLKAFPRKLSPATIPMKPRPFTPPKVVNLTSVKATLALPSGDARLWAVQQITSLKDAGRASLLERHLRSDPSSRVRSEAARALATVLQAQSLPTLIPAAEDGDPGVRFAVIQTLAEFNDPGALTVLQQLASSDPDASVRAEARDLLEPTTPVGKRLLQTRIQKLSSANPGDRLTALTDLSRSTHWRAMAPMSCTLLSDKSAEVRTAAAKILVDMHDTTVLTAMRLAAETEPDKKLQANMQKLVLGMRKKVDLLVAQLRVADPTQRALAARALGQAAYPPGLKPLTETLKDADPRVRRAAVVGLTNFTDPAALEALKVAQADADPRVRQVADGFFKSQKLLESWRSLYQDPNRLVMKTTEKDPVWRFDAAIALGISGAERAVGNLVQLLLHDPEESVRHAAAWALVLMASDRSGEALKVAATKDPSEKIRLTARKYLVIDKVSVDDLLTQLADENPAARIDAAEGLSLRASRKFMDRLIRAALCDSEPRVRSAALRGLTRIGDPIGRSVIKTVLARDPDPRVRRTAMVMYILAGSK